MNLADMFGKIQQMQENMQKVRDNLDNILVEGEAGGGMVRVSANANKRILKITIDKSILGDAEMMEDLVVAAVNKALEKAEVQGREALGQATQGMLPNIPGLDLSKLGL